MTAKLFIYEYQPTWCTKFYNKFISSLYMFRAHVLIVRRAKLYYTASGIITLIGGRPVQSVHGTATYRCDDTRDCIIQFCPPDDEHICSKHVEAWNKLIIKFGASSWLIFINKSSNLFWEILVWDIHTVRNTKHWCSILCEFEISESEVLWYKSITKTSSFAQN